MNDFDGKGAGAAPDSTNIDQRTWTSWEGQDLTSLYRMYIPLPVFQNENTNDMNLRQRCDNKREVKPEWMHAYSFCGLSEGDPRASSKGREGSEPIPLCDMLVKE